jgi:hypothetical protein
VPATVAGCAALLSYVEDHENEYDGPALLVLYSPDGTAHEAGSVLLSRIAAVLEATGA